MLSRADDLARMAVFDADGRAVELGTLWRDRPAVLDLHLLVGEVHRHLDRVLAGRKPGAPGVERERA